MGITGIRLPGVMVRTYTKRRERLPKINLRSRFRYCTLEASGSDGGPGVSGEGEAVLHGFAFEGVVLVDCLNPFVPDEFTGAV